MKARLVNFAFALSLLVSVAVGAMWVRSQIVHDYYPLVLQRSGIQLQSVGGALIVVNAKLAQQGQSYLEIEVDVAGSRASNSSLANWKNTHLTNPSWTGTFVHAPRITMMLPTPMSWFRLGLPSARVAVATKSLGIQIDARVIPYWALMIVFLAPPVARFIVVRRSRGNVAAGCCPQCGYDLRATPDRCPECGLPNGPALVADRGTAPHANKTAIRPPSDPT